MKLRAALLSLAFAACGGDDGAPTPGSPVAGCDGSMLLAKPTDPVAKGPWEVGARTVALGRLGKVEVWYPAPAASIAGKPRARYDLREALNASQRATISDADNPWQDCDCYRDLPLDDAHGPYPAVVFIHGTAGFRHQSLTFATHWASRGFIVIAADHPGLVLGDVLTRVCPDTPTGDADLAGDVAAEVAALGAPTGDLGFLAGHVDASRIAIAGHSAGASVAANASALPGVRVVIGMAGNQAAAPSATLAHTLFMAGDEDTVVPTSSTYEAWQASPTPRSYFAIIGGAHLVFSDLCQLENAAGQNLLEVANQYGLCGAQAASFLFNCDPAFISGPDGWAIVNFATTALLEDTLQCQTTGPALDRVDDTFTQAHAFEQVR